MLRSIHTVSYAVPDFGASCAALEAAFDYRRIAAGRIANDLASFWDAAQTAGARYAVFAPASAEPVQIRLIEQASIGAHAALQTFGWNAAELHVEDVRQVATRLADSPYEILGGPRDLLENGSAIALQVRGPSDEVFYLTQISGRAMQRDYGKAAASVGRVFIAVLGSSDHEQSLAFYAALTQGTTVPRQFPIRVLAAAHGLDPQKARFPIASAVLREQFRIEIDGYPETAIPRPVEAGLLPPGLCLVSFLVDSLQDLPIDPLRTTSGLTAAPYDGRQTSLLEGPDGELLELIVSPS